MAGTVYAMTAAASARPSDSRTISSASSALRPLAVSGRSKAPSLLQRSLAGRGGRLRRAAAKGVAMGKASARRIAITVLSVLLPWSLAPARSVRTFDAWANLKGIVSSLFPGFEKSGSSLDPNGRTTPGSGGADSAESAPGGSPAESGSSLDPDGVK